MIKIKKYSIGYKQFMIEASQELEQHEHLKLAKNYLQIMLDNIQESNSEIFISFIKEQPNGFISYHYVNDDTVFETDDSNRYALISDICISPKYNYQGLSRLVSLADNNIANKAYLKYDFTPHKIIYEKIIGENL